MKVAIGVILAHGFPAPTAFWDSYELMMHEVYSGRINTLLSPERALTDARRIKATSFPIDFARNEIIREWLRGDEDYLFFLDCDHTFAPDILGRLLAHDKAVITARYHMRKPPYHACAFVKHRFKDGQHCYSPVHYAHGLIEIERGGAGALLIRRDVAEAIQFRVGENWFRYQRGPEAPHDFTVSEDFWFYQQAREAGFSCWCDWETEAQHLQQMAIDRLTNLAFLDDQIKVLPTMSEDERRKTLDGMVVIGYPDGYPLPTGDVIPNYTYTPGER